MKKPLFALIFMLVLASCSGDALPNITPTFIPSTFVPTGIPITATPFIGTGTAPTPSPTRTRTPTPTRTPTIAPATNTPRPPTVTAIGTQRARTPIGTPNCGNYDCGGVGLPNLPLLNSPTPYEIPTSLFDTSPQAPNPTSDPRTLIALNLTPIFLNGTEVGSSDLINPVDSDDLEASDSITDLVTPVSGGGEGDPFGNGGNGLGFGGAGNNAIGFGMSPNDTIWIAYAKGLLDPNINLFGPFTPLVVLAMSFLGLQFILLVANLFIPIVAITIGILRKIASTIADFTPF